MQATPWPILLIEDDEDDFVLLRSMLSEIFENKLELRWLTRKEAQLELACAARYRLVFIGAAPHAVPSGFDLAGQIQAGCPSLPIIMLTSYAPDYVNRLAAQYRTGPLLQKISLSADSLRRALSPYLGDNARL